MKRFSLITASLSLALIAGLFCSCHKPEETTVSTTAATVQTTTSESTTTSAVTETTPVSEPSVSSPETTPESTSDVIATQTEIDSEYRHVAKGKFNYVLKNKDWKFDGEMYYHKYKDGTTVYYDKEVKAWFVMDKSGQGWYYVAEINDFVKDE